MVVTAVLWVMGIVAAASLWWWWSLWKYPLKRCPACAGEGRIFAPGREARRVCGRCGGTREVRRWGAGKAE